MGIGLRQFSGIRCLVNSLEAYWELQRVKGAARRLERSVVASLRADSLGISDTDLEAAIKEQFHADFPDVDVYARFLEHDKPALLITERGQKIPANWWEKPGELVGDHLTTILPWTETDDGTIGDFDGVTTFGEATYSANNVSPVKNSTYSYQASCGSDSYTYAYLTLDSVADIVWTNTYVYFDDLPATDNFPVLIDIMGTNDQLQFRVFPDGRLEFYNSEGSYNTGYYVSADTWYWISILVEYDADDVWVQLYVNDVEEYARTKHGSVATAGIHTVRIGIGWSYNNSGDIYYDQCNVQTTRKTEPSAPPAGAVPYNLIIGAA